jgi:hypothetical protein
MQGLEFYAPLLQHTQGCLRQQPCKRQQEQQSQTGSASMIAGSRLLQLMLLPAHLGKRN